MKANKLIALLLATVIIIVPCYVYAEEHIHEYVEEFFAPTCENEGYYYKYCDKCGFSEDGKIILPKTEHNFGEWISDTPPTCIGTGSEVRYCKSCHYRDYRIVPATGIHVSFNKYNYPATQYSDGEYVEQCVYCNLLIKKIIYPRIKSIELKKAEYVFDGKNHFPKAEVTSDNGRPISKKYCKLTFPQESRNVGEYTVKTSFINHYYGNFVLSYKIIPRSIKIKAVSKYKNSITVLPDKLKKEADGYIVSYSPDKSFKKEKQIIKDKKSKKCKINSLKQNKNYYIRVCAFTEVNGKKINSKWSKVKKVKTR